MPPWIKNYFLKKDQEAKRIWVIRHGHRHTHQQGSFGNDLILTREGRQASLSLGQLIAPVSIGEIHTSPILRCIQTTKEILKGANQKVEISQSKVLGDPGPFISDSKEAGPLFLQRSIQEIAQALVNGEKLPGMRSLNEGGRIFLSYLHQVKQSPCLMISHDIIICLLCCFLFKSKNVEEYMPSFLEGFAVIIKPEHMSIYYRDQKRFLRRI